MVKQFRPNLCRINQPDVTYTEELPGGFADKPTLEDSIRAELAQEMNRGRVVHREIIYGPFGKLFDKCKRGEWPVAGATLSGLLLASDHL